MNWRTTIKTVVLAGALTVTAGTVMMPTGANAVLALDGEDLPLPFAFIGLDGETAESEEHHGVVRPVVLAARPYPGDGP